MHFRNHILVLIMFFIALASVLINPIQARGATSGTINIRVSTGDDDAEEAVSDGDVSLGSSDLELIHENSDQIVGIRFQSITIPQGSTITNAYIVFTVDEETSETTSLTIWGEKHAHTGIFSNSTNDISSRPKTSASVIWDDIPTWGTVDEEGVAQQTPDLSAILQEIVDQPAWIGGNAATFIFEGSGKRVARSYNNSPAKAPLLHIEYTSEVVEVSVIDGNDDAEEEDDGDMYITSTDLELVRDGSRGNQTVGIRFQDVQVPAGALITNAYLMFETDETTSEETNVTISAEAIASAPAFTTSNSNISSRTKTGQFVEWNSLPAWDTWGEKHQTPDLSAIVQEIVGTPGWISGNDMVFIITGSGQRTAGAYEDPDNAGPFLHIEYSEDPVSIITVDNTTLGVSCYEFTNPDDDQFTLSNTGGSQLEYTITDNAAWLSFSSNEGSPLSAGTSADYAVSYNTSGLSEGTYEATITITSPTAQNLVSPAILVLLDVSSSMTAMMDVSSGEQDPKTPDLTPIVQEIIGRSGWASGNAMAFIITGSGHRTAKSYNGATGSAPLLHVEYTYQSIDYTTEHRVSSSSDDAEEKQDGSSVSLDSSDLELVNDGGNGNQTVGIRFQGVAIPADTVGDPVTVTNAYIEFVVDETQTETTNLTIWGQDFDDPSTFSSGSNDISGRNKTAYSVNWNNLPQWGGTTQQSRIDIGKSAISDLVKDRAISWGYGTWCFRESEGYILSEDFTKVHIGTKQHTDAHQQALQDAITATQAYSGTPFGPSVVAAKKYFAGTKADDAGDTYVASNCQPKFLIDVTDGQGYEPYTTVDLMNTYTRDLADSGVTPIGVGFGLDPGEAAQLYKMAEAANDKGDDSESDDIFALHEEIEGVAQPFFANNKQELVEALNAITENVKGAVFHGSAPAPTTSVDLVDMVIVAKFDASRWIGDLEAVKRDDADNWNVVDWTASDVLPTGRELWTVTDPDDPGTVTPYTTDTLANDNFQCATDKPIGDIINSTPVVVAHPPFWYPFDGYMNFLRNSEREPMIYVGANDGFLHAFRLADGVETWAFMPHNLQAKVDKADDPLFDRCAPEYCHQYFVDGNPIVGDVFADFDGDSAKEWRTILLVGQREGGQAYFALDVTSGKNFNDSQDPTKYLWEFSNDQLGETWCDPAIERVGIKSEGGPPPTETFWGAFFGSGYLPIPDQQANKQAYIYGIEAHDAGDLWKDVNGNPTNRYRIAPAKLGYTDLDTAFGNGELVTGQTSGAQGLIIAIDTGTGILTLDNESGTFQSGEVLTGNQGGQATVSGTLNGTLLNDALASPLVADMSGDNKSDRIYVGNSYGNMYRISSIAKNMTPEVTTLFTFGNTSPNENPIRAKADFGYAGYSGDIWVYFGTGRYESQADKQDNHQQYFFGLKESITPVATYTPDDLVTLQAKFATIQTADGPRTVRTIEGSNDLAQPWKLQLYPGEQEWGGPLSSGSERVTSQPLVFGGIVFFTTFIPDENVCAGSGETYVFALDYRTGLPIDIPIFDFNGDGDFNSNDQLEIEGQIVSPGGLYIGRGQGSKPVIHKDTLFVTITGDGSSGGGGGDDDDDDDDGNPKPEKLNMPALNVRLENWRHK